MTRRAAGITVAIAVVASLALGGCGTVVSTQTAVREWSSAGSFGASVTTLRHDQADVHHEIAFHRPAINVKTDCLELFQDANGANTDELTTPDDQLTHLLSGAYDDYVQASDRCVAASGDAATLASVSRELVRADALLVAAVQVEEALAGRRLGIAGIP